MGKARNDLEYERFTNSSDGKTAVRVVMPDGVPVNITGGVTMDFSALTDGSQITGILDSSGDRISPSTETSSQQIVSQLQTLNSLVPGVYDYISLAYNTTSDLTGATFKLGGTGGTVVSSLLLAYDTSSNLTSVTKL
jgi:hypothetical protein